MYTLVTNEKLGMPVEEVRLAAIRQEIEARRLAGQVQGRRFGIRFVIRRVSSLLTALRNQRRYEQIQTTPNFEHVLN